jgi:cytoskeletal protein CcmA (bactofilin family)
LSGTTDGDARLAAQTINLNGEISGNVTAAAQSISSSSESQIGQDAELAAQDIVLNGTIERDTAAAATHVTLGGEVGRDLTAMTERLVLSSGSQVAGNVEYTSDNQVSRQSGAEVGGEVTRHAPKRDEGAQHYGSLVGVNLGFAIYWFFAALLVALVLVLLLPRLFHAAGVRASHHLGKTFLVGFVASIVVPILILLLMITVIGLPLGLLALLVWLLIVLLSGPFAAYLTGRLLLRERTHNAIYIMLAGSALLLFLYFVPFLGVVAVLAAFWFGVGMILMQLARLPRPHYVLSDEAATSTRRVPVRDNNKASK